MTRPNQKILPFDRVFFGSGELFTRIGEGELGGKAQGLLFARDTLGTAFSEEFPGMTVDIPVSTVVATGVFDSFMEQNNLYAVALSGARDERIAHAFQAGSFPVEIVGDLKALIDQVHAPLAVRSSSLLEDALAHPFAGVYETKMIPNNQADSDVRFRKLVEAIKFVYASVFFEKALGYVAATSKKPTDEKMAVIIQEVVGERHGDRFYPTLSGVCRSYNYYRSGKAKPEEGVVNLALGLGKTIVDGGVSWTYSPAHPKAPPPFASVGDRMKNTQLDFWAVNMGAAAAYDPVAETEYLVKEDLHAADYDGTLRYVASTYDSKRGRLVPGTGIKGPRVVDFAPLLEVTEYPLNRLIERLLSVCENALGTAVEIEFAVTFSRGAENKARVGFLQVRPMLVSKERIDIGENGASNVVVYSQRVMGNGVVSDIRDVVFVKPTTFEARFTPQIARDLGDFNRALQGEKRPYLLIGFGRWGSSDPWLGIPVNWGQISGARVIVESTLPNMNVEPSQGAHFFHNISSFQVSYFTVRHDEDPGINWLWLEQQTPVKETELIRHARLERPLEVRVDGRIGRGVVLHSRE